MEVSLSKTGPNLDENCIKQVRKKQTCCLAINFWAAYILRRFLVIVVDICMVLSTLSISSHVRGL